MPPFPDRVTPTPTESDAQGMFSVQTIYVAHFVFFSQQSYYAARAFIVRMMMLKTEKGGNKGP